jgi:tyrosine-protein phosphatase YwqE
MLDSLFMERLDARDILPLGNEKQAVLVETSFWTKSSLLNDMLKRTLSAGYYPVLAHPERYSYMTESDYNQLLAMGVKFQLNLPSLTGLYGPKAQKTANTLLKKNAYTYVGSDLHSRGQLERVLEGEIKENDAARVMEIKR